MARATSPFVAGDETKTAPERRADALVEICRFYLAYQPANPSRRQQDAPVGRQPFRT